MLEELKQSSVLVLFGALALPLLAWGILRLRRRQQLMREASVRLGFEFSPRLDAETAALAASSTLAAWAYAQPSGRNVLRRSGEHGSIVTFDYSVPHRQGRAWTQTVVLFILDSARLPAFLLRPVDSPLIAHGEESELDVDLRHGPRFQELFILTSPNAAELRSVFGREVITMIEEQPGICIECSGDAVMFFYLKRRVHTDHLMILIENAERTLGAMLKQSRF